MGGCGGVGEDCLEVSSAEFERDDELERLELGFRTMFYISVLS